jgi:large-conductance mechanosensitive channel
MSRFDEPPRRRRRRGLPFGLQFGLAAVLIVIIDLVLLAAAVFVVVKILQATGVLS